MVAMMSLVSISQILVSLKQQMRPINIKFHADQKHGVSSPVFYYTARSNLQAENSFKAHHDFLCHRLSAGLEGGLFSGS